MADEKPIFRLIVPHREIALRLKEARKKAGLSVQQLADKCQELKIDRYPNLKRTFNYNKINEVERWTISDKKLVLFDVWDVRVIAEALELPNDFCIGEMRIQTLVADPLVSDPFLLIPGCEDAKTLFHRYQTLGLETIGWSEFIPCSREPERFMKAHHASQYALSDMPAEEIEKILRYYNDFGNKARERFLQQSLPRPAFRLLMFESDIRKIALGQHEYSSIECSLRREALKYLFDLVIDVGQ